MTRAQAMRTSTFYTLVLAFGLFQISITVMLLQTIPFDDRCWLFTIYCVEYDFTCVDSCFSQQACMGILIDRYSPKKLAAIGAALTGGAVLVIVYSVATRFDALVYSGFIMMGFGWGGLLPLQEVIWATTFGRRYLGSVRSTALPFVLGMAALGPVLVAYYYDQVGKLRPRTCRNRGV